MMHANDLAERSSGDRGANVTRVDASIRAVPGLRHCEGARRRDLVNEAGCYRRFRGNSPREDGMVGYFFAQAVHQPLPFTALPPKRSQGALAASAAPLK